MTPGIHLLATTRNSPTAIDGLHPGHYPGQIFRLGQISAHQLFQRSQAMLAVINRSEMIETQQLRQSSGVDLVALVAFPHGLVFSRIAHHHSRGRKTVVWFTDEPKPNNFFFQSPFRSWKFLNKHNTPRNRVHRDRVSAVELPHGVQILPLMDTCVLAVERSLPVLVGSQAPRKNLRTLSRN